MDFRILGPVEARADGRVLSLGGPRQRAFLALMLLSRGVPVSRDRLVEDLWGEEPPGGAAKTLQVVASRLRRALADGGSRLQGTPGGYRLLLEPGELDLERFEQYAEEGRRALAEGLPDRAAARLRAALAEWRGQPLADLAYERFAQAEVAKLEALRAAALEDRIECDLRAGRDAALVPELEELVGGHPLRERLRAQLMLALYRSGRQGDALDSYRDAVRMLEAELGLRPSPELERLQRAILAQDPALRVPSAVAPEEPERRRATATILFTDLVGSTRMREELGDEAADEVRREHDRRLRDALAMHGGLEVKTLGDGFLALFDSAGAAVACSADIQRAVDRQVQRGPVAVAVRVGIGAGDVAREGADVYGSPVVEAERMCGAAGAGEILVTDAVRLLAGSAAGDALEDAGELALRGFERPVRAWRVRWAVRRTVAVPLAPALVVERAPAFAGRSTELGTLRAAWQDGSGGRRRGIFVSGEPGIGKTRLAAELAAYAREHGGVVLYGRCDDGPAAAAQPFVEALSAYAAACPRDELRAQLGGDAGAFASLLPSLATLLPGVPDAPPAAPEVERLRLLTAVAAFLGAASASAPLVLVLDDLHWADELSLLLLRHLLRADEAMRLVVLGTYRDTEPSRSPLLAEAITGLARRPDVTRLELGPLEEPDVAAILADAGREPAHAARVRTATEGNPFFVVEAARALDETGGFAVTPRIRDLVSWRLARLPEGTTGMLDVAAVVGAEFDADVTAAAAGIDLRRALEMLEAAERARLVRPAQALDRFAFAHALVRQTILEKLPAARRVRLHARVARALEGAAGTRAVAVGDLATHFAAAGTLVEPAEALAYARAAAEEAAARLAFDVAAAHCERALTALDRTPDASAEERLELELGRGRALRLAGDAGAHAVLRRAAADADAAGDGRRMAEALLTLGIGPDTRMLAEDGETVAMLNRALTLLPEADSATRAQLLGVLAHEALTSVADAERHAMVDRALAMARTAGDATALASVLKAKSWLAMGRGHHRERLALAGELVAIGRTGPPYAESDGHLFRHIALAELGDLAASDAALAEAIATARLPLSRWAVGQWVAVRSLLAGRLGDAEAEAVRTAELGQEAGFPAFYVQTRAGSMLWCIRVVQGRLAELEPLFRSGLEWLPVRAAWSYVSEAQLEWEAGDGAAAHTALAQAFEHGLLEQPSGAAWAPTLQWAAGVCAGLGDGTLAAPLYETLEPYGGTMTATVGPIDHTLGRLALARGDRDDAERRLRRAMELCERMDARAYLALARHDLGALLLPSDEGRGLLEQAHAVAAELGMRGLRTGRSPV